MDESHLAKSEEKTLGGQGENFAKALQWERELVASEAVNKARVVGTKKGDDVI